MNRNKRLVLSLVCTLALVLIPMFYLRAQQPTQSQQDQIQQSTPDVNQDSNLNQEKSTAPDSSKQDTTTREKPSSTEQNTQSQDQNQYQSDTNKQNTTRSKTMTESESKSRTQRDQSDQSSTSREGLPATAGELPLIALIGLLSVATAFGTRAFSRAKTR